MTMSSGLLAQLDGLNPLNPTAPVGRGTGLVFKDVMVIIATGLALGLVLLLGTRYYLRNKKRRHLRHHEDRPVDAPVATRNQEKQDEEARHHHHRRRRRRREHRPRNPTLGETGGLPPTKTDPTLNPPL